MCSNVKEYVRTYITCQFSGYKQAHFTAVPSFHPLTSVSSNGEWTESTVFPVCYTDLMRHMAKRYGRAKWKRETYGMSYPSESQINIPWWHWFSAQTYELVYLFVCLVIVHTDIANSEFW